MRGGEGCLIKRLVGHRSQGPRGGALRRQSRLLALPLEGMALASQLATDTRARRAGGAFSLLLVLGLALHFELLPCPFAAVLSVPCPGCGLTRAAGLLLRGDWHGALALHPLSPLLVPGVVALVIWRLSRYVTGGEPGRWLASARVARSSEVLVLLLLGAVVGVWVARFFGAFGGAVPVP
jgi:hypothetical protein